MGPQGDEDAGTAERPADGRRARRTAARGGEQALERRAASRAVPDRDEPRNGERSGEEATETETAPSRVAALLRPSGENGGGAAGLGERVGRWLSGVTDRPAPEAAAPAVPARPAPRPTRSAAAARRRAAQTAARRRSTPALWTVRIVAFLVVALMLLAFALLVGALA